MKKLVKLQGYDFRFFNMMMDLESNWMPMRLLFYQSVQQTKAEISWINYCQIIFQPRQLLLQESLWSALASTLDPLNLKENLTSRTKSSSEIRILAKVIWKIFVNFSLLQKWTFSVMGVKGRRVHMIEEMSDTIISFQRG